MTKTKSLIVLCTLALFVVSLGALGVDVSGDWEITSEGREGPMTRDAHFEQDGENITVTMQGFRGDEMTGEGTIKGNEIEWSFNLTTQRGDMTITYNGNVEGDTMSGTVQFGDFGSREWTAKKK